MADYKVGLTGGLASGKSTVAAMFAVQGVRVVDADRLVHALVGPGGEAVPALVETFGREVLGEDGGLDRPEMRRRAFGDAATRRRLEGILHPMVRTRLDAEARAADGPYVLLVIPLLVETGMQEELDHVIVVDCPKSKQRERLVERDGISPELAERMLDSQTGRAERLAAADTVIDNSAGLEDLGERIEAIHQDLLARAEEAGQADGG